MKVIKALIHQHRAAAVVHALKDAGCRNLCVAHGDDWRLHCRAAGGGEVTLQVPIVDVFVDVGNTLVPWRGADVASYAYAGAQLG